MKQYTIEHRPAQSELVEKKVDLYASQNIYVNVDEEDELELARLEALIRYGVVVRPSTKEEEDHVWDLEVELECHDPDVARHWPEEEAEIILEIKDW